MTSYADAAALKAYLRIPEDDSVDDVELELALASASREIDHHTGRSFGPPPEAAVARYYAARWDRARLRYVVDVDDFMTVTGLAVDVDTAAGQTWSAAVEVADIRRCPLNAAPTRPWSQLVLPTGTYAATGEGAVRVTALFGWTAVPDEVVQACLMQAARNYKRRDAAFGVAGSPEMGSELRLLTKLDVDVQVLLRSVMRWWGAR